MSPRSALFVPALLLIFCLVARAEEKAPAIPGIGPTGPVKKLQAHVGSVVLGSPPSPAPAGRRGGPAPRAPRKPLHTGFGFTEGPAADKDGNVYFSDIPNTKILKVDPEGKLSVFTDASHHANGLMINKAGEIVACEMDGQIAAWNPTTKKRRVLAAGYKSKRFNAPNDLVIDKTGGVYFTDPGFRAPTPLPQGKTCVYYMDADGDVSRLIDDLPNPNGVILSPNEKTLYVIPSGQADMMAYPVQSPGKIGKGRVFCTLEQPPGKRNTGGDGLTIDTKGNLYIASGIGLQVYSPKGKHMGNIELPEQPANVTFGGPGNKTLYVTARKSLYLVPTTATGHVFAR
jgi:gluconolactonase